LNNLWFKLEGANPSGSYKDRFAAAAVTRLVQAGRRACLGTSSGNTGAALAAYCARAGLACHLAIVEGAPEGKLRQMRAYGANLVRIRRFGSSPQVITEVMQGLRGLAAELGAGLEISAYAFSPQGMAGVETIGLELGEAIREGRFHVFSPAGGGGLTLATARAAARLGGRACVHCVQPRGNDTIASALRSGRAEAVPVTSTTSVSGLQVGSVLDGHAVLTACRALGGQGYTVDDEVVFSWQTRLAREEGIFAEPAGAVALAGAADAVRRGELAADDPVVCLVTGSGFKDERSVLKMTGDAPTPLVDGFADFAALVRADLQGGK
jgi:threonine synthase